MRVSVATVEPGPRLHVDGAEVPLVPGELLPRSLRSTVAYLPVGTPWAWVEEILCVLGPGSGHATRGRRRGRGRVVLRTKGKGALTLQPASAWSFSSSDVGDLAGEVAELRVALEETELYRSRGSTAWPGTAATVAGWVREAHVPRLGRREKSQLQPRYRGPAHAALTSGPQMVLRSGGVPGQLLCALDQRRAYLRALTVPVGLPRSEVVVRNVSLDTWRSLVLRGPALVQAHVWVEHGLPLGPLPVFNRTLGITEWPTGYVHGWFPDAWLREIEAEGWGEVVQLQGLISWERFEGLHIPAMEAMEELLSVSSKLKPVYLRYWGRLAGVGGWRGEPVSVSGYQLGEKYGALWREVSLRARGNLEEELEDFEEVPDLDAQLGSRLRWTWHGHGGLDHRCPPDYRPDHAALISWGAVAETLRVALHMPSPESIYMLHVDSVWTSDLEHARRVSGYASESWRVKEGPYPSEAVHFPRTGAGITPDRTWASGVEGGLTAAQLLAERPCWGTLRSRVWNGPRGPAERGAVSEPPHIAEWVRYAPSTALDPGQWSPMGWLPKEED